MRKRPQQQRAIRAVDALIDATAQVITERGFDQTTTNHIAARAGVSVGSLYQYFEGKDDLIEELLVRLSQDIAAVADDTLARLMAEDAQTMARGLLETALTAMESQSGLYVELARNWHRLPSLAGMNALQDHMMDACRRYFLRHHEHIRVENMPAVLFVVINSTLFTVIRHLSLANPPITKKELIDTLSAMIATFLEAPASMTVDDTGR